MTDEEKKAIEDLKEVVDLYNDKCLITTEDDFKSIEILLNLIEKQQKEIEELKEDSCCMTNCVRRNKEKLFLEDKIKAKIKEYDDKDMTVNILNRSAGKTFQQAVHYEVKKVLQSLLRKEFPVTITKEELEKRWKGY